jgi:hypothetical protein
MIVVIYTAPKGKVTHGIMMQRDAASGLIEVAFDQTETKALSIGWINPLKPVVWVDPNNPDKHLTSKIVLKSNAPVHWRHRAMRLIEAGNILEARAIYAQEEEARKQERIRRERGT